MNQKPTFGRPHLFYFVTSSSLLAAHRLFFVRCSPFATSCPSLLAFRHFFVPPPPRLHSASVRLPSFRPTLHSTASWCPALPCCLIHFVATIFQEDWQSEQGYSALFFLLAVVLCSPSRLCPPRCSRFFAILELVMCQLFALRVARRPSLAGPPRCSSPSPRPPSLFAFSAIATLPLSFHVPPSPPLSVPLCASLSSLCLAPLCASLSSLASVPCASVALRSPPAPVSFSALSLLFPSLCEASAKTKRAGDVERQRRRLGDAK
jgi:hypothetical protein